MKIQTALAIFLIATLFSQFGQVESADSAIVHAVFFCQVIRRWQNSLGEFDCVMWIGNKISTLLRPAFSGSPDGPMRYQRPSELIEALATKAQRYRYTRHSILL